MDNRQLTPGGSKRERRKNQILMATVATFLLLLLVFAVLLTVNAVMAIRDRIPNDEPQQPEDGQPTDPEDEQGSDTPTPPEQRYETYPATAVGEGALILVNASHVYSFPETEAHLVNVSMAQTQAQTKDVYYMIANNTLRLDQTAYQALNKMLTAFSEHSGRSDVLLADAYRSYEQQASLGSSTKAGYSEHHTGLTLALNVRQGGKTYTLATEEIYDWIYQNCHKYGFIARYPADKAAITGVGNYEECFRYVGYVHAYVMKTQNKCLEEYIDTLRNYTVDLPMSVTTDDGSSYEIYYVAATGSETQIPVPDTDTYTISGDNDRGFIVTVKLP